MHPGAIAALLPDKPAVIMASSGKVVTFRELDEESNRLAHLFRAAGLRPGDHIAFMLENHPLFLAVAWAAHRSGLYYTAISSRLKTDELAYIVDNCEARVFVSSVALADVATSIADVTPKVELRLMLDGVAPGFASYEEAVAAHPVTPLDDECQGADMLYSSGTTGRPKGVKPTLSQAPLDTPGALLQLIQFLFAPSADSVYLSTAPLYHAAPLRYCMSMQRMGVTLVVMERFDPEQALALIEKYRRHPLAVGADDVHQDAQAARGDPRAVRPVVADVRDPRRRPLPGSGQGTDDRVVGPDHPRVLRGHRGQRLPLRRLRGLARAQGHGRPPAARRHPHLRRGRRRAAAARARHRLLRATARRSSTTATRTRRRPRRTRRAGAGPPSATSATSTRRASSTSPTARSYMIISGGVNIYPQEAENILTVHPKVADVAVFGVPDEEMGEQVKAVVQPVSMAEAGPGLEAELIEYCRSRLAPLQVPEVDRLP